MISPCVPCRHFAFGTLSDTCLKDKFWRKCVNQNLPTNATSKQMSYLTPKSTIVSELDILCLSQHMLCLSNSILIICLCISNMFLLPLRPNIFLNCIWLVLSKDGLVDFVDVMGPGPGGPQKGINREIWNNWIKYNSNIKNDEFDYI